MGTTQKLDKILTITIAVLAVALVGLAGYFGYTVYRDKLAAAEASPALRVIKVMKAEVKRSPNDAVLRVRLGEALAAAGKVQEAIEQLNAALKIDPKHTGAYMDLGLLAMSQKRFVEAERYFRKVIELTDGGDYEAMSDRREISFYNLGLIALEEKEYEDAIGNFKAALRIRKDASDSYYYLARAFYLEGEPDAAIPNLESALAFDPNFAQASYLLGQIYFEKGDKINASYWYYKSNKSNPDAPEPKAALKRFGDPAKLVEKARSLKGTDPKAAIDTVLIARNLLPEDADVAVLHAQILEERRNFKGALKVYREALELDPDNKDAKAKVKSLEAKYGKPKKSS